MLLPVLAFESPQRERGVVKDDDKRSAGTDRQGLHVRVCVCVREIYQA